MRFKINQYPSNWRWRFALFPTHIGEDDMLWLEFYQVRKLGPGGWERRDRTGNTFAFSYY